MLSGELCSRAGIAFQFSTWTILKTECAPAGRVLTNRLSTFNKSIDQWRDRLKAVVWVNGGHIEQLFWIRYLLNLLSCSVVYHKFMRSKNVHAFCHCVPSVTVVLWQKVNLTNNHLIFQNKIGVILCDILNWHLIWHIIQHTALASSYWTTKNKGYVFY